MKTQSWAIFARVRTAKRSAGCNHGDPLEDDYCVCSVLQVEISYPYITSHTLFAEFFKYPQKM